MRKFSYVYLPILFLTYLIVETVLKLNHSSLCHTRGCELAGTLLNIPAIWLNYMGIFGAFILLFLGYFTYLRAFSKKYFFIFLSTMIFFETIMLGYQYFASPEICIFCLGVYTSLLMIALFTMGGRIFFLLPGILALGASLYILAIPKSTVFIVKDGNYLIQSKSCPHCKKVKKFLKDEGISFNKIDSKSIEARNFIKFLGYNTIPVLIIKSKDNIKIYNGDKEIIDHFKVKSILDKNDTNVKVESQNSNNNNDINNIKDMSNNLPKNDDINLLDNATKSDGCGIDLLDEQSCNKDENETGI